MSMNAVYYGACQSIIEAANILGVDKAIINN
jgi:hypothetical protein